MFRTFLLGSLLLAASFVSADSEPLARTDLYGDPLPAGALARLGTVRFRHGGYGLTGLTFLPDGKTLAAATEENTIVFWDAGTGRRVREISLKEMHIRSFTIMPDGKLMAVGGFWYPQDSGGGSAPRGEIRILETATGKFIRSVPREPRGMDSSSLLFTPDGRLFISLGSDGALRIQEVATGVEILQQNFSRDYPSLAMSPDGTTLAIATGPNTRKLYVWKWQSGEDPREVKGLFERPQNPAFSQDSRRLAVVEDSNAPALVLDVDSLRPVYELAPPPEEYFYSRPVFSPDGKTVALVGHGRRHDHGSIHFWDAATGQHRARLQTAGGNPVFSPDSRLLAATSASSIRVWELPSLKELSANDGVHRGHVSAVAVGPSGEIATASDDGTLRLWDLATTKQRFKFEHAYWIRSAALSPDGTKLASSSLDGTVRLWDAKTGRQIFKLPGHGSLGGRRAVRFTPDSKRLLSFGDDYYLRVWEVRNGKAIAEHAIRPSGIGIPDEDEDADERERKLEFLSFGQAVISPDGKTMAWNIGNQFHVFDTATGKEVRTIANEGSHVISLAYSPDSKQLLASAWGRSVATPLPDGTVRHSSAKNHPVCLWDLATGKLLVQVNLAAGGVGPAVFAPTGKTLAVAASAPENTITVYEVASGQERFVIKGVPCKVSSLAYTPDGRKLISGMQDSTVLLWDVTGNP